MHCSVNSKVALLTIVKSCPGQWTSTIGSGIGAQCQFIYLFSIRENHCDPLVDLLLKQYQWAKGRDWWYFDDIKLCFDVYVDSPQSIVKPQLAPKGSKETELTLWPRPTIKISYNIFIYK